MHNKLINQAARTVLKPLGLFQKGSSRVWIDDNDWFLTIVEFQSSAWGRGSYLNVSIHYLWSGQDWFSFDYGHREQAFVEFQDSEAVFLAEMTAMAEKAAAKVRQYRFFRDPEYAQWKILDYQGHAARAWELYHKMMICGLRADPLAKDYYEELLDLVRFSAKPFEIGLREELTGPIAAAVDDPDVFQRYILAKVRERRDFWRGKSGMKKLR